VHGALVGSGRALTIGPGGIGGIGLAPFGKPEAGPVLVPVIPGYALLRSIADAEPNKATTAKVIYFINLLIYYINYKIVIILLII